MDEYVLSPNTNELLIRTHTVTICVRVRRVTFTLVILTTLRYLEVNAGLLYGNVTVFVQWLQMRCQVTVTYNGVTTTTCDWNWESKSLL